MQHIRVHSGYDSTHKTCAVSSKTNNEEKGGHHKALSLIEELLVVNNGREREKERERDHFKHVGPERSTMLQ